MRLPCAPLCRAVDGGIFTTCTHPNLRTAHHHRDTVHHDSTDIGSRPKPLSAKLPRTLHHLRRSKHRFQCILKKQTSSRIRSASVSEEPNSYDTAKPRLKKEHHKPLLGENIPWGWSKIIQVMSLWMVSFLTCRSLIWKAGMWLLGLTSEVELSAFTQAAFTLFLDLAMLATTVFIIGKTLQEYRPFKQRNLFPYGLKGKWWPAVVIACICIPLVDWLGTNMTVVWFPEDVELPTNNVVVQLSRGDVIPNVMYFVLLAMCAPVWEELMFRGFLLQSLGKFFPASFAVSLSSGVFAIMHGNTRQFFPLWVLGMIIGQVFVRTRNLFPAVLLHSLYNCYVFAHVLFGS